MRFHLRAAATLQDGLFRWQANLHQVNPERYRGQYVVI